MAELERGDPREIGGYRVLKRLGAGGMGVVNLGRSPAGTLVAVKVVRPGLVGDGRYRARFRREVAAARSVTGAYTAPLVDADPDAEPPWLATAYLPGLSLDEAVGTFGALPAAVVRLLAVALAEALAGIHGAEVVHRDLKPGNIMLTPGGPRVIDFGIARPEDSATLTQDGALLGTPGFMSPEQAAGGRAGPAADVFALGSVLAFATAGRGPFDAGNRVDTLQRIQRGQADLAGVTDRRLRTVVAACLRPDPRRRPPAVALLDLLGEPTETGHGTRWLPAAVAEAIDARTARVPWPLAGAAAAVRPGEPTADPFAETGATAETGPAGAAGAAHGATHGAVRPWERARPGERRGGPGPAATRGDHAPRTRRRALLAALTAATAAGAAALAQPLLAAFDRDAPPGDRRPHPDHGAADPPPPEAERAWRVRVRDPDADPPGLYVAGGTVFVHGGGTGGVRAVDPRTGDEVWRRRWGSGAAGEFAAGDGTAFLVGPDGAEAQRVRALDAASGGERWTYEREFAFIDAVAAADGLTCIGDGGVVALDTRGGGRRWSAETTAFSLTIGSGIVLADNGAEVTALDAAGGKPRWRHPAEDTTAILVSDGLAFVCDAYLRLVARPVDDRVIAWEKRLTYPSTVHAAGGGMLYVSEPNGHLRALRASTGDEEWSSPGTEFLGLADGAVHVWGSAPGGGTGNGTTGTGPRLYALDPADGEVLWAYDDAEPVGGIITDAAGLVFAVLANGYVEALSPPPHAGRTEARVEPLEPDDPRSLGGHRILARLGSGATAVVYLGRSRGGRLLAVKVVHAERARRPQARDHFVREVAATAAAGGVYSPSVVGADPGGRVPWMATEFVPSVSLHEAVERFGPLPGHSVRRLAAGLAEALVAVHRAGVVHRDVKPANVLLTADGPKLVDFGIAAAARPAELAGTPGFMSPEQVAGAEVGPATDVYSLGSTLAYAYARGENDEAGSPRPDDDALRSLIADCRRLDPAERPTPAALGDRLARDPGPDGPAGTQPAAAWLPAPVLAAIDAHAGEAANPPLAPAGSPRRRLLLGGAAAVAAGAGAVVLLALREDEPRPRTGDDARPAARDSAPPATQSEAEPEPAPEPIAVEFALTGDGPVEKLTYAVNRRPETLKDVSLPWRRPSRSPGRSAPPPGASTSPITARSPTRSTSTAAGSCPSARPPPASPPPCAGRDRTPRRPAARSRSAPRPGTPARSLPRPGPLLAGGGYREAQSPTRRGGTRHGEQDHPAVQGSRQPQSRTASRRDAAAAGDVVRAGRERRDERGPGRRFHPGVRAQRAGGARLRRRRRPARQPPAGAAHPAVRALGADQHREAADPLPRLPAGARRRSRVPAGRVHPAVRRLAPPGPPAGGTDLRGQTRRSGRGPDRAGGVDPRRGARP